MTGLCLSCVYRAAMCPLDMAAPLQGFEVPADRGDTDPKLIAEFSQYGGSLLLDDLQETVLAFNNQQELCSMPWGS